MLPNEPYDSILVAAQLRSVRFLVVEEQLVESMRPQLAPLIYDAEFLRREERVELAYIGRGRPGYGVALFRVLRPTEHKSNKAPYMDPGEFP